MGPGTNNILDRLHSRQALLGAPLALVDRLRAIPAKWGERRGGTAVFGRARRRFGWLGISFIAGVILPTVIGFGYLSLWAANEYVSEARFIVRTASDSRPSGISDALSLLSSLTSKGGLPRTTTQDVYIVADYVRSRSVIEDVGGKAVLYQIYSNPLADWFSRLEQPLPIEDIWKYWRRKVTAIVDTLSGVTTLQVRAFTSEDAHRLAEMILAHSEELVNKISERSRRDTLARAEAEVDLARGRLSKAREALLEFRNKSAMIDPVKSAASIGETVTQLVRDKILLENNRAAQIGVVAADSPILRLLEAQITAIDNQIASLQQELTSQTRDSAISSQIAGYEDLTLQTQFAEKLYSIAQASYEKARVEADKQQLFLATIVRPTVPEQAFHPRIVRGTFTVFAACLVLWSMISLVLAAIRDHTL